MTAIRDNLCELKRLEIPRPKCQGMQFVATRGRQGFYRVSCEFPFFPVTRIIEDNLHLKKSLDHPREWRNVWNSTQTTGTKETTTELRSFQQVSFFFLKIHYHGILIFQLALKINGVTFFQYVNVTQTLEIKNGLLLLLRTSKI